MKDAHKEFKAILTRFIDPFKNKEKAWNVGFNNRYFDDVFPCGLGSNRMGTSSSVRYSGLIPLDTLVLASQYLIERRAKMPSFKQHRVARELGIVVEEDRLHDASYDVELTRGIYRIVTGLEVEI